MRVERSGHRYGVLAGRADRRRRLAVAIAVFLAAGAGALALGAVAFGSSSTTWTPLEAPLPPGGTVAYLYGVSCPAAGACVAGGELPDGPGAGPGENLPPLVETLVGGSWTPSEVPLPVGGTGGYLSGISCPAVGACVAVGTEDAPWGNTPSLVETQSGSSWTASGVPLPSGGSVNFNDLGDVSCPAVGSCVAVGWYYNTQTETNTGLIETLAGGIWTPSAAPLPATGAKAVYLDDVSCAAVGWCVATGTFIDAAGFFQGVIETLADGSWVATTVPGPPGSNPVSLQLGGVSCPAVGACVAVGSYNFEVAGGTVDTQVMIETLAGGSWTANAAPLPADANASGNEGLSSVSCPTIGSCVATGDYTSDASGPPNQGLIEALSGGIWTASEAPLPADASASGPASLNAVSCPTIGSCVAVGSYTDVSGNSQGLIETVAGLSVTTTSLPRGVVGTPYSAGLAASGGITPYSWSVVSGALPAGLSLDAASGVISGTPQVAGTSTVTVKVTDASSPVPQTATATFSITVAQLAVTTSSLPQGTVGVSYSAALAAGGGTAPYSWSVVSGALPAGLSLDAATGVIAGKPKAAGSSAVMFKVTDSSSPVPLTATRTLSLVVSPTLSASPTSVWANGHRTTKVVFTYAANQPVSLSFAPSRGVALVGSRAQQQTGAGGQASWRVASTQTGTVTFTAQGVGNPSSKASVKVHFIRHKVVVQVLGINSSLRCSGGVCRAPFGVDKFASIRSLLLGYRHYGYSASDFLWYSYRGGAVDRKTGAWVPSSYPCGATAQDYRIDLIELRRLIVPFADANPNTDIYLVGHSQGGLIALQELGYLSQLPKTVRVAEIITLDSPLGGTPLADAKMASLTTCWKGQAVAELGAEYRTPTFHHDQGGSARLLCARFGCPDARLATTNSQAFQAARRKTRVMTLGNVDDAVYNAPKCHIDIPYFDYNNVSTEIIPAAAGGLSALGGDFPLPQPVYSLFQWSHEVSACIANSHTQVTLAKAATVAQAIGPQPQ